MENTDLKNIKDACILPNSVEFVDGFRDIYRNVIQPAIKREEYSLAEEHLHKVYDYIMIMNNGFKSPLPNYSADIILLCADLSSKNIVAETKKNIGFRAEKLANSLDSFVLED